MKKLRLSELGQHFVCGDADSIWPTQMDCPACNWPHGQGVLRLIIEGPRVGELICERLHQTVAVVEIDCLMSWFKGVM